MNRGRDRTKIDSLLYMVATALVVAYGVGLWDRAVDPLSPARMRAGIPHMLRIPAGVLGLSGQYRVLLIGCDDRNGRGRADTIMILQVNGATHRAALVSVPRDTLVEIPGHKRDKINHAYRFGGIPLLQAAVEELVGYRVHRYVKLDFDGLQKVVDAVGGVEITVPDVEGNGRGMNYDDYAQDLHIHLRPGLQRLNGKDAMGYVRYRCDGGKKRMQRQRQFLKAVLSQHLRADKIAKLIPAIGSIHSAVKTDLSIGEAGALVRQLAEITPEQMMTATLPVLPSRSRGLGYSELQEERYRRLCNEVKGFLDASGVRPITLSECVVVVLNGSGRGGAADAAAAQIRENGGTVSAIRNADRFDYYQTEITHHPRAEGAAERIKAILATSSAKLKVREFDAPGAAQVIVTVGRDYRFTQG